MIGDLILRRSMRSPSLVTISPAVSSIANKQFIDNELHLPRVEQHGVAPPLLELQIAFRLRVDVGIDIVGLFPESVRGIVRLEIRNQPGAVKHAVAEIAHHPSQPGPAQQAAEVAHRVLAAHAGPVGERRPRDEDRAGEIRAPSPPSSRSASPPGNCRSAWACRRPAGAAPRRRARNSASARHTSSIVCPGSAAARSPPNSRDGPPSERRRFRCRASCRRCRARDPRADRTR